MKYAAALFALLCIFETRAAASTVPATTTPPKTGFATANGIKLHYLDWGGSGHKEGHSIMSKIKSFTVGLPVTELKRAVEWYRQLGEVEEVNPVPGVGKFQIVPSGWLQLFESEINEPNASVMRFESHDIEATRALASSLGINVGQIETVPEAVRYFEFGDPFGNRLSFYELLA